MGFWSLGGVAALGTVGALLGAAAVRRRYLVVTVKGPSMRPSLDDGDRLLVHRRRRPVSGDVVVFQSPPDGADWAVAPPLASPGRGEWNVKRVVAVPGDLIPADARAACRTALGARVPAESLIVFGDGTDSYDSRAWGLLPLDRVLGVARRRLTGGAGSRSDVLMARQGLDQEETDDGQRTQRVG